MREMVLCVICAMIVLGGCTRSLSPEEQAQVQALRSELEVTKKEIAGAEVQNAQYAGGLVKALISLRLEILKTNEALIQQRIHAIESGAKVTIQTFATRSDTERAKSLEEELTKQQLKVSEAEDKASLYSRGLVGAMAVMGAATERNTLAMLRQQYLIAKHGLASPQGVSAEPSISSTQASEGSASRAAATPSPADSDDEVREHILDVTLLRKQYVKQNYHDYIYLDFTFNAKGLDKPARAIKGVLRFADLFGEQMFALKWTVDTPIAPGVDYTENEIGFEYNQFSDSHKWVRGTDKENMKVKFRVDDILYEDGTKRTFD